MANYFCSIILVLSLACLGITINAMTITRLLACSSDMLTFRPSEALLSAKADSAVDLYWYSRYRHSTPWMEVVYCNSSIVCKVIKPTLSDGTKVTSGVNGSLIVERSAGSNSKDHVQFKFEVHFKDGSVDYHVYEVSFTAVCVWTWLDANVNLTRVFLNLYPREQIVDIELYDTNGTKFAHYNPNRGATVNMTGVNRPMPVFWKRLKVSGGSLVLTGIQRTENRLEITAKAHLRTLSSKARGATRSSMETVDSKSIRIRVNTTQGSSTSANNPAVTDRSTIVPVWFPPTKPSGASAAHVQLWIVIIVAVAAFLYIAFI